MVQQTLKIGVCHGLAREAVDHGADAVIFASEQPADDRATVLIRRDDAIDMLDKQGQGVLIDRNRKAGLLPQALGKSG
ncbi:hypothetical protein GCM10008023_35850 [Sphingomonas glacialis]|uniref:Uncharacterized protein n=1 Tax=Sphingomonas glacialis TaxID=658225 RepID=A0ABQ3LU05_9SPHN|nr:hypothetical protein GCM10008023_35850 [Sphingomonas glacialis]